MAFRVAWIEVARKIFVYGDSRHHSSKTSPTPFSKVGSSMDSRAMTEHFDFISTETCSLLHSSSWPQVVRSPAPSLLHLRLQKCLQAFALALRQARPLSSSFQVSLRLSDHDQSRQHLVTSIVSGFPILGEVDQVLGLWLQVALAILM